MRFSLRTIISLIVMMLTAAITVTATTGVASARTLGGSPGTVANHPGAVTEDFYGFTFVDPLEQRPPTVPLTNYGANESNGAITITPAPKGTIVMRNGTLFVTHYDGTTTTYSFKARVGCVMNTEVTGTYRITGGTGVWKGVEGGGTFFVEFQLVVHLSHGACPSADAPSVTPIGNEYVSFTALGTVNFRHRH